jgi:V8-like Glu-specific endopeptidase
MTYAVTNQPIKVAGFNGPNVWVYKSADAIATVQGAAYFSDGDTLGMKVGDVVLVSDTATPLGSVAVVSAVTAGTGATVV